MGRLWPSGKIAIVLGCRKEEREIIEEEKQMIMIITVQTQICIEKCCLSFPKIKSDGVAVKKNIY